MQDGISLHLQTDNVSNWQVQAVESIRGIYANGLTFGIAMTEVIPYASAQKKKLSNT